MGIPRTLRDFQARWESRCLDFSSARLFHGLAGRRFQVEDRIAPLVVATQAVRPIAEAQSPVQVLARNHGAARQRCSPAHGFDLQSQVLKADRVVPVHRALELQRKNALQILAAIGHKRTARLCRFDLEAAIKLPDVTLAQEGIRRLGRFWELSMRCWTYGP